MAVSSLLAKIGTSDPVEVRGDLKALAGEFDFGKIGRAPARFDDQELANLNAQLVHAMPFSEAKPRLAKLAYGDEATEDFWDVVRANLTTVSDAAVWLAIVYADGLVGPDLSDEDKAFVGEALKLFPDGEAGPDTWSQWTSAVKDATGRKGKQLFMPLRRVLTDQERGPEMDKMLVLIGAKTARWRLEQAAAG